MCVCVCSGLILLLFFLLHVFSGLTHVQSNTSAQIQRKHDVSWDEEQLGQGQVQVLVGSVQTFPFLSLCSRSTQDAVGLEPMQMKTTCNLHKPPPQLRKVVLAALPHPCCRVEYNPRCSLETFYEGIMTYSFQRSLLLTQPQGFFLSFVFFFCYCGTQWSSAGLPLFACGQKQAGNDRIKADEHKSSLFMTSEEQNGSQTSNPAE